MKGKIKLRIIQLYINACNQQKKDILDLYTYIRSTIDKGLQLGFFPIVMGDFNADLIKFNELHSHGRIIPWKFRLITSLLNLNFIETYSQFHDKNIATWKHNNTSACLDHIWISHHLLPDLLFTDIL